MFAAKCAAAAKLAHCERSMGAHIGLLIAQLDQSIHHRVFGANHFAQAAGEQ